MRQGKILQAVIDTNVIFEGLTKKGESAGWIIDCWIADVFQACVSDALAYEYVDVLSRKLSESRFRVIQPVIGTLLTKAEFITIHYRWRPVSPDPEDDHVIDCSMNAGAILVTSNTRDFFTAMGSLGLIVNTPVQFIQLLVRN